MKTKKNTTLNALIDISNDLHGVRSKLEAVATQVLQAELNLGRYDQLQHRMKDATDFLNLLIGEAEEKAK